MNDRLILRNLRTVAFSRDLLGNLGTSLLVTVSGYEKRARFFSEACLANGLDSRGKWAVIGFKEHSSALSRPSNDQFYTKNGKKPHVIATSDYPGVEAYIEASLANRDSNPTRPISVHIDYSCMPRNWYCNLVSFLDRILFDGDEVYFWYSAGEYPESDYPTAGVSDFSVYSGQARLNSRFRVHFFGLGFDRIRASAIYSVIDPQYLVCYYADPGVKPEYVMKVQQDNEQVIKDSQLVANVPVNDFCAAFSRLCALSNEFLEFGDVIFVPDGPKPLVLASSLVPEYLGKPGVICFHVTRRKNTREPIEVKAIGDILGFSFEVSKPYAT